MIVIKVKDYGEMKFNLDYKSAPNTCKNFVSLARKGFYNGVIFHRVIKNFMIQGGDPTGTGMGGPGYSIKGEFRSNGFKNDLKHDRGVISMARSFMPNSAGSQFFVMHKTAPHLDGEYAAFGTMESGFDVLDAIACTRTNRSDRPLKDIVIETVEVIDEPEEEPEIIQK
ncbi:MAG TPA: peptidylprolyl isomerase [Firmicutes bacterium]|jgi:peptidyl-prolyl cis-trans isomerase B (cyclophilin B)|nr:peptidyl-prolyl cis-trans isomerase [Clostridium sp. CAG:288]HAR47111.1 peptidylprolyl isomerase [Bacillota bacterium]HAX00879.1 peptidylprolyl isomerase [Bacillota bacterium]